MVSQAACALAFFSLFPGDWETSVLMVPYVVGTVHYPFAKRHANVPQLVLGFRLSWGVFIGALSLRFEVVSSRGVVDLPLVAMFTGCTLWMMIYDILYAHLDLQNDLKLGVGSTALLFQGYTKQFL
jgi:4-hydroxybenzoate polyprenyltransferase